MQTIEVPIKNVSNCISVPYCNNFYMWLSFNIRILPNNCNILP